jgi:hypothetical protein
MDTPRRRRRDREAPSQSSEISGRPTNPLSGGPSGLWIITTEPTYDDIARRAYELYQQRGCTDGEDWRDWFQAENELRNRDAPEESLAALISRGAAVAV